MKKYSIFFVFCISVASELNAQVLASDSLALVALYNSTNGSGWTNRTNWLSGPVSAWFGITVTGNRVSHIQLPNNQLNGNLPAQIGSLTSLQELWINSNLLSGPIPPQIGSLSSLESLQAYANNLSGPIPTEIGNLTNLISLNFDGNPLTGTLPESLKNLVNLQVLTISSWGKANLTGEIPAWLADLTQLRQIWLDGNSFTGNLPDLTGLVFLDRLMLFDNQLTGTIRPEIASLPNLRFIGLQSNQFSQMADFSGSSQILQLQVANNYLQFDDLVPSLGVTGYVYSPQLPIPGGGNQSRIVGQSFTASFSVGGVGNVYQWQKDSVNITGANSSTFTIPSTVLGDAGTYQLLITNALVPGLTLYSEQIILSVSSGPPIIEIISDNTGFPAGSDLQFSATGVGSDQTKDLEITNTGLATLVVSDIQVTGEFSLLSTLPPPIAVGNSETLSIRFAPTGLGKRTGTLTILSNGDIPAYTINLLGEGDAEPEVFNVVTTNSNGKHDFLNIRNITLFPNNRVSIYDRWGNLVFEKDGYDNANETFTGISSSGKELAEGTYYYVLDKGNGSQRMTGFIMLKK
ncbi:MAG: choice-of-anchor D domain-containing protein [Cyclobacteriaceae bacterium]|nr:MAG: choice-of-anchor D domain-containing protein [Cyclobacteriaceae bacterium]